jgi:glyoxylase-like metal-dependent hydrolase (beta-lactamase superfamily II)
MTIVEKDDRIRIEKLEIAPFGTNAYILVCEATGDSVLVDAPGEARAIADRLRGTNPKYILMTHDHIDHVGALAELKSTLGVPVAAHSGDAAGLPAPPDVLLNDGDTVSFGKVELRVLHTPGHTPGSVCFLTGNYLISGDTLFPGGPGRTNTPAALKQVIESITGKLFPLPDDVRVHPGHGDSTVLKKEKEEFAVFSSRSHDPGLCGDVLWLSS